MKRRELLSFFGLAAIATSSGNIIGVEGIPTTIGDFITDPKFKAELPKEILEIPADNNEQAVMRLVNPHAYVDWYKLGAKKEDESWDRLEEIIVKYEQCLVDMWPDGKTRPGLITAAIAYEKRSQEKKTNNHK